MQRIGQLYQRKQTGSWYCKVDGKQVKLGPTEAIAKSKRDKLVRKDGIKPVNGSRHPTVNDTLALYMQWHKSNRAPSSHYQRIAAFLSLNSMFGDKPAKDLSPANVLRWVETHYGQCGNTRQNDLISYVQTAFNWIERHHNIPSQLKSIDKPTKDQREFYLPFERWPEVSVN